MTTVEFSREFANLESILWPFAIRLTRNPEDAKDLMQETAVRAFRYRSKFTIGTNFKSWCSTIMRNTFINQYRRKKVRRDISEPIDTFLFAIENKNTIANEGEHNIRMETYEQIIADLSDLYKVPFLMFFRGYEYKEIASILDIPIGTVKSRIFLARQKLRAKITEQFGDQIAVELGRG